MTLKDTRQLPIFHGITAGKCPKCQQETKLILARSKWLCVKCHSQEMKHGPA